MTLKKGTTLTLRKHMEENDVRGNNNAHQKLTVHGKDLRFEMQKGQHSEEGTTLPEQKTTHRNRKRQNSAFQNGTQKNDVKNDTHGNSQTTSKDLKNHRSLNKRF
jgi:hypothetical protein